MAPILSTMVTSRSPLPGWAVAAAPVAAFLLLSGGGSLAESTWVSPITAFWLVVVVTFLCAVGAVVVIAIGWRRRLAEVTILGSCLLAASVLPLVHGWTIPGVLYPDNPATMAAAFLAVPVAVLIALPLVLPGLRASRAVAARWRLWSIATALASVALAAALLLDPELLPAPRFGHPLTYTGIILSLGGTFTLAHRQLRLYRIGGRRASLLASIGFAYLGLSTLVFLVEQPFSVGWWSAHLIDAIGVVAGIFGVALAHARDRSLTATLAPIVNRDPLVALELGLTPLVHRFIAALERKDPITRDHVVRVGELSMRTGVRAGTGGSRLRALGIGALLHDVGKLLTPDRVLTKPGALSDREFEIVKEHSARGAEMMRASPLLAPAADLVRWHHERADGGGYPDGLRATELPLEAGIISACDGWDAMTSARPYREAMTAEGARRILREGAGSQWTDAAVELLLSELDHNGPVAASAYDRVGRDKAAEAARRGEGPFEVCPEALPAALRPRRSLPGVTRRPSAVAPPPRARSRAPRTAR